MGSRSSAEQPGGGSRPAKAGCRLPVVLGMAGGGLGGHPVGAPLVPRHPRPDLGRPVVDDEQADGGQAAKEDEISRPAWVRPSHPHIGDLDARTALHAE
jgi:hypothetical protein